MKSKTGIGIIGGGQMAEALIKGFLEKKLFTPKKIFVSEPLKERREYLEYMYKIKTTASNRQVLKERELVLLAVKPQVMEKVLNEIKEDIQPRKHLLLTIAAGLPLTFYQNILPESTKIIRIMPNTCALVQESASALCGNEFVSEEDMEIASKLFSAIGEVVIVPEELMDGITALSGSGPAYVALFIEALIDGGVKVGLPRALAEKLAIQTVLGTAKLFKEKKDPYQVKAMVTSPGGTTIAALKALYEKGVPGSVMEAVERAYKRSLELSNY